MKLIKLYIALTALILLTACSATKFISDGDYLLDQVEVKSAQKDFNVSLLEPYVRQKANSKWFSLFKIPLATYSLSGTDTIRWINRTLKNIGEAPVVYDTVMAERSCEALRSAMSNMGYLHSEVELQTRHKGKKVRVTYILKPGEPYYLRNVRYDIADDSIRALLDADRQYTLRTGAPFTVERLDAERNRITNFLLENGYYKFNKDFIHFSADSARDSREIDLTLHLDKYRPNSNAPETLHPRYTIGTVSYASGDKGNIQLRPKVLQYNTAIIPGTPFSANALQKTYNNFARLKAIRYTNIKFSE